MTNQPLSGYRFLVVDDEPLILMYMTDALEDLGATVKATASRLDQALAAVEKGGFDCATLDINLAGVMSYPVAEALSQAQIPFVFCSSYSDLTIAKNFKDATVLNKPVAPEDLTNVLIRLLKRS